MTSPVGTLYVEELKATMRGRFAWLGAAVILSRVGGLATVATQDTWLDGYGIIAYCLVPLAFIPFAAGAIASPRANRFVESVFTAPVERRTWLAAKVLVLFTLAGAYYLALVPMLLVYTHHVGLPFLPSETVDLDALRAAYRTADAPGLAIMSPSVSESERTRSSGYLWRSKTTQNAASHSPQDAKIVTIVMLGCAAARRGSRAACGQRTFQIPSR